MNIKMQKIEWEESTMEVSQRKINSNEKKLHTHILKTEVQPFVLCFQVRGTRMRSRYSIIRR